MTSIFLPLLEALELQRSGSRDAENEVRRIATLVCGSQQFRDDELTAWQVQLVERLLHEWKAMFSFSPGRLDCLSYVTELLRWIRWHQKGTEAELRSTASWDSLMSLRGPGANVLVRECKVCDRNHTQLYFGSFAENSGGGDDYRVCEQCGHVLLSSLRAAKFPEHCACGGPFQVTRDDCHAAVTLSDQTPYEYFRTHTYGYLGDAGACAPA